MSWNELKNKGNPLYKTEEVEPIDLYRAGKFFKQFAIGSIIKYAYRNAGEEVVIKDFKKIIHYAELVIAEYEDRLQPVLYGHFSRKL